MICFSDTDLVIFSNQSYLKGLNLYFIFINLKKWVLQLYNSVLRMAIWYSTVNYWSCIVFLTVLSAREEAEPVPYILE